MKFVLFVEGYTEKKAVHTFIKRWLDLRLERPVGISIVRFNGWAEMRDDMQKKACMHLHGPDHDQIIAVVALLDFYGPTFYPPHLTGPDDRYRWAVKMLEEMVGEHKFHMFFAVHEVEAWLLSNPGLFPREIRNGFPGRVDHPETVNFDTPPAKMLDRLFLQHKQRHYEKVTLGTELFKKLDPGLVYEKCPYFRAMMDQLLVLAHQAGL